MTTSGWCRWGPSIPQKGHFHRRRDSHPVVLGGHLWELSTLMTLLAFRTSCPLSRAQQAPFLVGRFFSKLVNIVCGLTFSPILLAVIFSRI